MSEKEQQQPTINQSVTINFITIIQRSIFYENKKNSSIYFNTLHSIIVYSM